MHYLVKRKGHYLRETPRFAYLIHDWCSGRWPDVTRYTSAKEVAAAFRVIGDAARAALAVGGRR